MMAWLQVLLAYLLGAIPFAYLAGRLKGLDIRQHGSGNVGAINVFRVLGKGPGAAVLVLDMAKGWAGSLPGCRSWAPGQQLPRASSATGPAEQAWWPCALGLAAVLGHSYTVFLRFKGGKGVATSAGAFLGLAPWATLTAPSAIFLAGLRGQPHGQPGLAGSGAGLAGRWWLAYKEWLPGSARMRTVNDLMRSASDPLAKPVLWLAVALAVVVWIRHIPNIQRILNGSENKFGKKKGACA